MKTKVKPKPEVFFYFRGKMPGKSKDGRRHPGFNFDAKSLSNLFSIYLLCGGDAIFHRHK